MTKELADVANMAEILMPLIFEEKSIDAGGFPPYQAMLISIRYHMERYGFRWVIPFDLSVAYSNKELFKIHTKVVESFVLQQKAKFSNETERIKDVIERFHLNYLILHHDIDEFLEQQSFEYMKPSIDMSSKWLRMTSDLITHVELLLGEVSEVSYEDFFGLATDKMKKRDSRYHGLTRLDDTRK